MPADTAEDAARANKMSKSNIKRNDTREVRKELMGKRRGNRSQVLILYTGRMLPHTHGHANLIFVPSTTGADVSKTRKPPHSE